MGHQRSERRPHGGQDAHRTMGRIVRGPAAARHPFRVAPASDVAVTPTGARILVHRGAREGAPRRRIACGAHGSGTGRPPVALRAPELIADAASVPDPAREIADVISGLPHAANSGDIYAIRRDIA